MVEDEHRIAEALKKGLIQENYAVDVAYDGERGLDLAMSEDYDCLILDLMLPKRDGLNLCRELRNNDIHTPILMLTAKSTVNDRVNGLNYGADDYLVKPFAFEELLARLSALLRRPHDLVSSKLSYGGIQINSATKIVSVDNKQIQLSAKEYGLLEYLMRQKGRVVSKEEAISHVWDYDSDILPNTVEAHIKRLRNKLGNNAIITIRGFEYKIG